MVALGILGQSHLEQEVFGSEVVGPGGEDLREQALGILQQSGLLIEKRRGTGHPEE